MLDGVTQPRIFQDWCTANQKHFGKFGVRWVRIGSCDDLDIKWYWIIMWKCFSWTSLELV